MLNGLSIVRRTVAVLSTVIVLIAVSSFEGMAQTNTATGAGGGTWATAVWSAGHVPTNAENAVINSGINLNISTAAVCASLTIGNATVSNTMLTLTTGGSLSVTTAGGGTGNLSLNPNGVSSAMTLACGAFPVTIDGTPTLSATNTQTISVSTGSISFTRAAGFTWSAGTLTITNNGSISFAGPITQSGGTVQNTTTAGTINFNSGYTKSAGTFTSLAGETINFGGNVSVSGTALTLNATSTSVFTGSGSVTPTVNLAFGHLTVNSGVTVSTVSAAGTLTIAGNLLLNGTGALNGSETVLLTGTSNIDGTGSIGAATTISALHTIPATANLTFTGTIGLSGTANRINNNGTVAAATITGSAGTSGWTNLANSTLSISGTLLATGTLTATASPNTIDYNGTGAQAIKAANYNNLTVSGARTTNSVTFPNGGTVGVSGTFSPTATFTSGGFIITGNTFNYNGTTAQTVLGFNYNNLTISGARTTNSVTMENGGTVGIAGTFTNSATFTSGGYITTNSTVNYNGSGAQTIIAFNYDNLTVAKSANTATLGATTAVAGVFTVSSGTASIGAFTFSVGDTTSVTGTLNITSATGTKTFTGPVVINAGGVWNNSGNEAITMQGGLTHNGTTFTAGTGIYTFDTNPQTIGGTSALTIPSITVTGVTLTNNGTLTVSTALAGTGGLTNGNTGVLNLNFTGAVGITTLTASSLGNTVNYGFAGAQTIKVPASSTYYNLTLSSSGAKTAGGALIVSGDLTLNGTATFNAGTSLTHNFGGNWILNTTAATPFAFTTSSTINFETPFSPAQTTLGGSNTATIAFNSLNIDNTSGFALSKNITASGTLTINAGATLIPGAANTVGGAGTLTGSGTVKVTRTAATPDFLSQYTITTKTLTSLTVDYDATAAQTVNPLSYFGLIIEGSRGASSVTLGSGTVGISGAFSPIASFAGGGYIITGNTVDFNGSGVQTVPVFSYNNLTLSNAGTKTFAAGTAGIAGAFTISGSAVADAVSNNSTIDYNGAGPQSVLTINYTNLSFSTSGVKTILAGVAGIAGDFTIGGTATADAVTNADTVNYNGGGAQSVAAIDYSALMFSNGGTKTLSAGTTRIAAAFGISGTAVADAVTNSTTVEFNGSVVQLTPVVTYYDLVVNSTGGRVQLNNVTVNHNFTVTNGRGSVAGSNFTVVGTSSITGEFRVTGTGGAKTLGDVVINNGGAITFTVNEALTLNGNLQVDGTGSITSGNGLWTFQKPGGGTISGTAASTSILDAAFTTNYANSGTYVFGNLAVSGSTLINNGTLQADSTLSGTGTLTQGSGSTLNLNFLGSVLLSTLNTSASGNTVNYSAPGAQTVIATNYANLSFSGTGIKTFSNGTTGVAGTFSVTGATADATSNATTIDYNGSGNQSVTALSYDNLSFSNAGTKTFSAGTTNIAGNLAITGGASADATTNNSIIVYDGTAIQSTPALTYANMTVNNSNGITLSGNATVGGILTLTNGTITTGASKVSISATGSVSRTSGYIVGNLEKYVPTGVPVSTFDIGDGAAYTPVVLSFASVSTPGTFTASTTGSDHPQILTSLISPAKSVNRYWTLTNSGVGFTTYDAVFNFVSGDVDAGANTAAFLVDRYNSGAWTAPTIGTCTATSTQATGIAADGDFQVGEQSTSVLKVWDGGAGTHNWDDALNWNPDGVPTSNNNVSLTLADTINIGGTDSAKSITLNNSALLVTIQAGHSLVVGGDLLLAAGTLNTQSAFPSVTGTVSITGGTVGYTASGAQIVVAESYYHLALSGSGIKTLAAGTTQIAGNFSLGGTATADATTNATTVDYNGSGPQAVGPISYYNLNLSNAGTKTFGTGTTGIANTFTISGTATADATTNTTTVDYNGTGPQTVLGINYHHLSFSNAGTKTLAAGTTGIAGNLTISGTATADATTNSTTINYNGSGSQTVGAINYSNLTLSNAGTKTFGSGTTGIAGNLSITGSASADALSNSATVDYNGSGNQTVGATNYSNLTLSNAGTKTFAAGTTGIASTLSITGTATANATSNVTTINYSGSGAQSIAQFDYDNLTLSNAGAKQFAAGTTNIGGDLIVSGSATLDATTNSTTIVFNGAGSQAVPAGDYGTLTFATSGTKTVGAGTTRIAGVFSLTGTAVADLITNTTTMEFNGSANQTAPPITYYNLVSSNTATRLLVNNVTVNNSFTIQVGAAYVAGSNFTVLGTTTLNGQFRVTGTAGAKTLGNVTVNNSGSINFTVNEDLTINGDLIVNGGGAVTSGAGIWTFQKSGGGVLGGSAASSAITNAVFSTVYVNSGDFEFGTVTITGTTFTNSGTVTVDTALTGNGTFAQGTNSTLNYNTSTAISVSTLSANASGNTVHYGAAASQSSNVADYYNLMFSGSGTKTFGSGTTRIAGTFTVTGSAVADATTNNPTVEFNGSSIQTVKGLTYANVKINNSNGISLNGTMTVSNALTLTAGTIATGTDTLRIGPSGTVTRTSGHIAGNLAKTTGTGSPTITYEVGDGSGNYTPVTVAFTGITVSGELTASTTSGDQPQVLTSGIEPSKTANRFWTLGGSGITYTNYNVTLNFVSGDLDAGANTAAFIVGRYQGGSWTLPTVGTRTSTSTQATGIVGFGDFQVGEQATAVLKTWDGGALTNNWGDAANWNPDGVPTSSNNVSLTGANTININVAATVNSITLNNSSLVVTIQSANSLTVSGDLIVATGTLNTQRSFPAVTGTVTLSGGMVGYTASGPQTVAAESYYHLTLSGSGTKTFATGTTVINGDLTLGGTATTDATTNTTTIDFDGSGTQSVGAINYYNLTLSNAGTKTFASGTIGVANSLTISGTAAVDAVTNSTTVDYNGSMAQTVKAMNYYNVSLSNGGVKTFAADTTGIAGNLAVSGSATADATTNTTTINYNGAGSQTVGAINYKNLTLSNSGTKTFASGTTGIAGDFTISGTAIGDAAANSTTVNFNGTSAHNIATANFFNLTLSNASSKILGSGTTGIAGLFTVSGGASADALTNSSTIDFDGGSQIIPALSYNNLTFSNSGTKTLSSDTTVVNANLTINGAATLDALTNSSTVKFVGSAIQTSSPATYYNLVIYKVSNRLGLNDLVVNHNFTIQAGEGRITAGSFTVNGMTSISEIFRVSTVSAVLNLGDIIVNNGGQIIFASNAPITVNGSLEVDGTGTVTSGTGLWTFQKSGGGGILSGTAASTSITNAAFTTGYTNIGTYDFTGLTVNSGTLTNNGTFTVGAGGLAVSSGAALTIGTSGSITVTGADFTNDGTVTNNGSITVQ